MCGLRNSFRISCTPRCTHFQRYIVTKGYHEGWEEGGEGLRYKRNHSPLNFNEYFTLVGTQRTITDCDWWEIKLAVTNCGWSER